MSKTSSIPLSAYFYGPLTFGLGFFGNIMGIAILIRLKKFRTKKMCIYLFLADSLYLLLLLIDALAISNGLDIVSVSLNWCRSYRYLNSVCADLSPLLLTYLSLERFIAIKYPTTRIRLQTLQSYYFVCVILFNLIYHSPIIFYIDFVYGYSTLMNANECLFASKTNEITYYTMDLVNRVIIPFLFMSTTTLLLIYTVFRSRKRMITKYSTPNFKNSRRDIKFSVTILLLNLTYITLMLPLCIVNFFPFYFESDFSICFSYFLFYMSYGVNFYIILISNSLVKKEFLNMLKQESYQKDAKQIKKADTFFSFTPECK